MNAIADGRRMAETGTGSVRSTTSAGRQASPIITLIDSLLANQESRNSWLYTTGEQARKLNEESRLDPQDNERNEHG